jgi:antitoxin component YwqK of YwqJK toxin-antitoxin module
VKGKGNQLKYRVLAAIISLLLIPGLSLSQSNQYDSEGRKHGEWVEKWSNGNLKMRGTFEHGIPTGELVKYDKNFNIEVKYIFQENDSVLVTFYHPNGKTMSEGVYVDQKKQGLWRTFDYYGDLLSIANYVNDELHGEYRVFYPGGALMRKTEYLANQETGLRVDYYEDGTVKFHGHVVDGKPEGKARFNFPDGKPMLTGSYVNEQRVGIWLRYNEDGSLKEKIEYVNGIPKDY